MFPIQGKENEKKMKNEKYEIKNEINEKPC